MKKLVLIALIALVSTTAHAAQYFKFKEVKSSDMKTCYYKNYGSGRVITYMTGRNGYCPYVINQ